LVTTTLPVTTTTVDPGLLPQTHQLPSSDDPAFSARTEQLWSAIVADDPSLALGSFFPRSAYLQVKAIANPGADYHNRLIAWFDLDIHAAHAFLGAGAAGARLTGISVPSSQAVWVLPGGEANRLPYYRVYGSRITFDEGGKSRSFGIFSFISWRGEWYVVHFGPSTRSALRGILYAPQG
jgi:hypothetical protein